MKSSVGEFDLDIPRDRNGSFEPQLIKKHQTHISDHIEQKILSLYTLGNSYSQISEHIEEFYGLSFSKATISAVTDKVIPMLKEWQSRSLESIYLFVWLDAIHYRTKGAFPNENSLLKLLYIGIWNAQKKWTMPMQNWSLTISQLAIFFEGKIDIHLDP